MFNDTDSGVYVVRKKGEKPITVEGEVRYGRCVVCSHAATVLRSDGKEWRDCACTATRVRQIPVVD